MIYLIKSLNYYKIGYADNVIKRMKSYLTNNPDFELIGIKEGGLEEEYKYHEKYCENMFEGSEWMELTDCELKDLVKEFNISIMQVFSANKRKKKSKKRKENTVDKEYDTSNIYHKYKVFLEGKITLTEEEKIFLKI